MDKLNKIKKLFKDQKNLDHALTHKSWVNESEGANSNERLEFLGDAVLELVVTDHLYKKLPDKEEGYLTALRANIVNTKNLSNLAKELDLGKYLHLSKGEAETGGRENKSLLADTVEAIIGGIYIDSGLQTAKKFINENLLSNLDKKLLEPLKDPKSTLQEYCQAQKITTPKYHLIKESGPDNDRTFVVEVKIEGKTFGRGTAKSKREAEQEAAKVALGKIK